GLSVADANLVAEKGNMNLQSNSNITLQGTTLDLTKDLNINGTGNVNLSSLNFSLLNGSSTLQNINAYSGLNLVWDQTAKALPQISGNVTLEAANLIDLKGSNLSGKGDLKLQGKALNVGADLTAGKSLNLTATQSDLILNKTLNAQGNID
ncbi:hemagglutinin, partial [Acinetobacter baumannii]